MLEVARSACVWPEGVMLTYIATWERGGLGRWNVGMLVLGDSVPPFTGREMEVQRGQAASLKDSAEFVQRAGEASGPLNSFCPLADADGALGVWSGSGPLSRQRGTFRGRAPASFWRASRASLGGRGGVAGQTGLVHCPLHRLLAGLAKLRQDGASLSLRWGWARHPAGLL